ncbi:collagen binding domain-containing protein [Kribbella sp. NPDC050124]|uniref:collagen binding domain-containing protein n=1 Tax=Kribbella sp. NPDC050124 TaxID=3364114 RepID=UPI00378B612C
MSSSRPAGLRAGTSRTKRRPLIAAAVLLLVGSTLVGSPALAAHPEVSLPGSNFEIDTDANLKVDDAAPSIDWANVAETRKADLAPGSGDNSFGQGTKEDTAVPTVVDGSIPPNKSDLTTFGVYLETVGTDRFLHMFWHRVQDPSGTTNMDFEFNQSSTLTGNGVTPVRTAGDLLIQYDLTQGGTNPQLFLSRWVATGPGSQCEANNTTPCWGTRVNLTASGDATGSINTSAIPAAESDGLGAISPRTFGEASVDFNAIVGGTQCIAFGSGYLKSRSSDSFTAALKDFIAPVPTNINICGAIKVIKTDDATPPALLSGAEFDLLKDNPPVGGSPGAEDTFVADCTTNASGECNFLNVLQGEYWVVETLAPPGHDLPSPPYQHVTVVGGVTTPVTVTFVDPRQRGAIEITKTRKHVADGPGSHPHAGVTFTVNGTTVVTDANGKACVDGLLFGTYAVTETVPANYAADGATTKNVTVNNKADCDDSPYVGETVAFGNTPLSTITVSFTSQVAGGTAAQISCTGLAATPPDGTPNAFDDTSESFQNLLPGTYTCTVVIDP